MKPSILIPQPIPVSAVERLGTLCEVAVYPYTDRRISPGELLEAVKDVEILFGLGAIRYDAAVMDAAPGLRLIAAMHSSATFVDQAEATRRGVPVTGIPNRVARTTAEFTFALLMATAWRIPEADTFLREGAWRQNQSMAFLGTRLYDKTLGIVGMGAIGADVAVKARACGMRILYTKRNPFSPAEEQALGCEYRTLEDLFRESDFIVLMPTLTTATRGMIDADIIGLMKPSAILINTSRGEVLDERALEDALAEGRIRGAGLDVFRNETMNSDRPGPSERLRSFSNVVLTPHIGTAARETREEMAHRTVDNIEHFLAGKRPPDVLNPEVYGDAPRDTELIG